MAQCQIQVAARYAFPRGLTPVEDRRMSLDTACREEGTYAAKMSAATAGKGRQGAPIREFFLCENHSQLVAQVDTELKEEGWTPSLADRPRFLS